VDYVVSILRFQEYPQQTNGYGLIFNPAFEVVMKFYTMELPWRENRRRVSRIPPGVYDMEKRFSKRYNWHFHITDVENRSLILMHHGNYHYQTEGCILPGRELVDINGDGLPDVVASRNTMDQILETLPDTAPLVISEEFRKFKN
jgi:hypothetical protein